VNEKEIILIFEFIRRDSGGSWIFLI